MDWLTLRHTGDPALPADIRERTKEDFERLRYYAQHLNADIIALQEVESKEAVQRLFDTGRYRIILTSDPIIQRVGLVVRRDFQVTVHPEVTALNVYSPSAPHPLRGGLDVTIRHGKTSLRVLVVHLKTGCWDKPVTQKKLSCVTLRKQFYVLEDWILDRQDSGEAYAILGDFNRRLSPHDPLMHNLEADAFFTLTTAGYASPCENGSYFIDHILLGNEARKWLVAGSLTVMTYRRDRTIAGLSDHCAVSVRLVWP